MLTLKNIVKTYTAGDSKVEALRDVSVSFRESEFVAVLGQSGCGKTTMLNIIGGLDGYTSGDLVINGKSTKRFSDRDWDAYRNHSIGFVFQSYNLIPHQSVLSNVELALTLTGVPRAERRRRAVAALESVGLGDQLHKKPNQMSGGQMQRVAIARALVNDPDIVLADEPTGALDSETSVQIMDLLKKVAENRLVIMVTHNPELAEKYATRTVRLLDGRIISDSNPYTAPEEKDDGKKRAKKPSMSFFTALSLSLNNLMTKKTRTLLTSFAGSIGIIGIALILAFSSGATAYINRVQEETLSSYPLSLQKQTVDVSGFLMEMAGKGEKVEHEEGKVYSRQIMTQFISAMMAQVDTNDIAAFKKYIEDPANGFTDLVTDISYSYSTPLNVDNTDGMRVSPSAVFENMGMVGAAGAGVSMGPGAEMMYSNTEVWQEMIDNDALLRSQYDVVAGRFPEAWDEVVLITTEDMEITDYALYSLGLLDTAQLKDMFSKIMSGQDVEVGKPAEYTYDELLGLKYKLLVNTEYFEKTETGWADHTGDDVWVASRLAAAPEIKVVGILCPSEDAVATSITGTVGYRHELMEHLIELVNSFEI
ncbi:MAG: ABC transporter ATP-binding protein, partial [Eubacteriales bacterium]